MRGFVALLVLAACVSCSPAKYACTTDEQCVAGGVSGRCESQGFCSFPDAECPSGSRFEENAAGELGGTCVPEGNTPDAPPEGFPDCGAVGQSCCPDDSCLDNMFCDAGTCKQCVTDVSHGRAHSCFLRYDNTIWCSGENFNGQLGNGGIASVPVSTPVQVRDSTNQAITNAKALGGLGENYSCAIRDDDTAWCWGSGDNCDDGGQLGNGDIDDEDTAVQVIRASDGQPLADVAEIHGAFCHTCARDSSGGLWCWGTNADGRLGDGTLLSKDAAIQVLDAPGGTPITGAKQLGVGAAHSCYRDANDAVFCFGDNFGGMIGDNTLLERPSPTATGVTTTSLGVGRFHTCAVVADQTMVCWGRGKHQRLGNADGDASDGDQLTPQPVITALGGTAFGNVASVETGAVSCALTTDGQAFCWGSSLYGQTGSTGTSVPRAVLDTKGEPLTGVTKLRARYNRVCAFKNTGELLCWGRNSEGQLGDETFDNHGLATPGAGPTCP